MTDSLPKLEWRKPLAFQPVEFGAYADLAGAAILEAPAPPAETAMAAFLREVGVPGLPPPATPRQNAVALLQTAAAALALASGLAPLAAFLALGAPFFGVAAFLAGAFSGATCAPCAATVAALSVALVSGVVIVCGYPFLRFLRA